MVHPMSAADIYATLKKKNAAALRECSCTAFSHILAQLERRVHTRYGNGYWVKARMPGRQRKKFYRTAIIRVCLNFSSKSFSSVPF
ncbi:DUF3874 domain-containing protein [uncultured Bacteroides sp.]|uniref:DUF3874 domain-containing protein n=1 Tax=uncultured Bacteroides sp. TaxID=162156 RepID=UPI00345C5A39